MPSNKLMKLLVESALEIAELETNLETLISNLKKEPDISPELSNTLLMVKESLRTPITLLLQARLLMMNTLKNSNNYSTIGQSETLPLTGHSPTQLNRLQSGYELHSLEGQITASLNQEYEQ